MRAAFHDSVVGLRFALLALLLAVPAPGRAQQEAAAVRAWLDAIQPGFTQRAASLSDPPDERGTGPPTITWAEPPFEVPGSLGDSVRFGYLAVPSDHAVPDGPSIRLAIAVVRARSAGPASDPVVSIAGGPGLSAIALHMRSRAAGPHPLDTFRERRDLVVLDARGHGYSGPERCAELDGAEPLIEGAPAAERIWLEKLGRCRARLAAAGVQLETLSSAQAARDLELLRRALGAPRLNLVGISYGSHIAAEAVRQVPSAVRAVYYTGPVPPGAHPAERRDAREDEAIRALFARCAAQAACRDAYPALSADYDSVVARLRRAPLRVPVPRSDAVPEGEVAVDDTLIRRGIGQVVLDRALAAGAPLLVHTLARRGPELLELMAAQLMTALASEPVSAGTFLAFWCNDGIVGRASSDALRQRCRTWIGPAWSDVPTQRVRSDVPGLIVTGEVDPRTPPSNARLLAAGMPRAHVVIVPSYGHERPSPCELRIARDFFEAPEAAPVTSCLDSIPPIPFVRGIVPSRWTAAAVVRTTQRPWLATLPGAAALLLAVAVIGMPVRMLRRRRAAPGADRPASALLLLLAVLALAFLLGLAGALFVGMRTHVFVPLIGVPTGWSWVLGFPWLLLVLAAAVGVVLYRRADGAPPARDRPLRWCAALGVALALVAWGVNLVV